MVGKSENSTVNPGSLRYLTGEGSGSDYPPAISASGGGGKFDFAGEVLSLPGNTFICHVDRQSVFYQSLSSLQDAIRALPQAHYMTFLPKPSFHMTIFCGVIGDPLGADGWPENVRPGATLESITKNWFEEFESIKKPGGFSVRASHLRAPYSVRMQPASEEDAAALLDARASLEGLTGLVRGDLYSYEFHVTLGYLVKWMDNDDAKTLVENSNQLFEEHLSGSDPVTLGQVEFCTFESMHHFAPVCSNRD